MSSDVPKKILWIFVFLILAAMAVLGVLFIRGYQANHQVASIDATASPEASAATSQLQLTVSQPSANVATSSAKMTVTGTSSQGALVTVVGAANDAVVTAQNDGTFAIPITLQEGLNSLQITAFNEDGDSTTVKHDIVYSKSL